MSEASLTSPISRRKTAGYVPVRIGTLSRSLIFFTTELRGTIGYFRLIAMFPEGLIMLAAVIADTISSGDILYERRRSGFTLITIVRALPPKGGGAETPGRVANSGRTRFRAASCISATDRVSLEKTRFPTGTLPASKRMMNGGTVPSGIKARERFTYATVSDMA